MKEAQQGWLAKVELCLRNQLNNLYVRKLGHRSGLHDDGKTHREIARILRAFHRIEIGTYGSCELCGNAIGAGRLNDDLATDTCDDCGPPVDFLRTHDYTG